MSYFLATKILFMVEMGNRHVLVWAIEREEAKRQARSWLRDNPDNYIVTPLTEPGDSIHLALTSSY
jgi:hypothetical protein